MELLKPGKSRHHLFSYPEIRAKLVELHGNPVTDEDHKWLHREVRRIHSKMPIYRLDAEFHRAIHLNDKA